MDFLEVSAKTVDDAITKACIELGLSSDQLEIQVISEGSSGFLGIGSKPAVIQVRRKKEKGSDHKSENTLTDNASEKKAETVKAEKIKNQEVRTSVQRKVSEEASADNRKEEKKTSSEEISGVKKSEKKSERENKPESKASEKKEVPVERTAEEIVTM